MLFSIVISFDSIAFNITAMPFRVHEEQYKDCILHMAEINILFEWSCINSTMNAD